MAESPTPASPPPRRNFMVEFAAVVVGGVVSLASVASGLLVFLDPLRRKDRTPEKYKEQSSAGPEGFVRIASLNAVPKDGVPRRFPVIADQVDGWNFTPDQPIGAVYIRRTEDSLQVFQATCPHLGCSVATSPDGQAFHCPCHNSSFDLDGKKQDRPGKENPSPRDMDLLVYDEELLRAEDPAIWVKYEEYHTGRHEKQVKL